MSAFEVTLVKINYPFQNERQVKPLSTRIGSRFYLFGDLYNVYEILNTTAVSATGFHECVLLLSDRKRSALQIQSIHWKHMHYTRHTSDTPWTGILTYIGVVSGVNVGIYAIHGVSGIGRAEGRVASQRIA